MNAKRVLEALAAVAILGGGAAHARAGQQPQQIDVTVRPAQGVEERVADEVKEKQLRKAAEERLAAEESARLAERSPRAMLARARTLYVESGTSYFEPVQLQNELRKRDEAEAWQMLIIDDYQKRGVADLIVEVDRPLFTFTFTYKLTDRATGVLLAAGKVSAFDGNAAAPKLAGRIIGEMKRARGGASDQKR